MDNQTLVIALIVLAVIVLAAIAYAVWQRRRSAALRERYGPEYDHTVREKGRRRVAEAELRQREKEHQRLDLKPLPPDALERYRTEWASVQAQFVDDPEQAVRRADQIASSIMADRGYPTHNFEEGAAQVSVDHPEVVQRYREAHRFAIDEQQGQATTEELRRAVTAYRSLVDVLLEDGQQRS